MDHAIGKDGKLYAIEMAHPPDLVFGDMQSILKRTRKQVLSMVTTIKEIARDLYLSRNQQKSLRSVALKVRLVIELLRQESILETQLTQCRCGMSEKQRDCSLCL